MSRRRSTLSSSVDNNHSIQTDDYPSLKSRQNSTLSQTPGIGSVPILPALPLLSPISRAFSIRSSVAESTTSSISAF